MLKSCAMQRGISGEFFALRASGARAWRQDSK